MSRVAKVVRELRAKYGLDPDTAIPISGRKHHEVRSLPIKSDPLRILIVGMRIAAQFGSPHMIESYRILADELEAMVGND